MEGDGMKEVSYTVTVKLPEPLHRDLCKFINETGVTRTGLFTMLVMNHLNQVKGIADASNTELPPM